MHLLFLVTAHNSLSQRLFTALAARGHRISVEYATSPAAMIEAFALAAPDVVLCPFLTRKVPREIYEKCLTLIVHPGAPGDAGPSALDWVLMGDAGQLSDSAEVLARVASAPLPVAPRSHWAVTVLQAEEEFDKGPVWAWEQFELPTTPEIDGVACATITKAALYRGQVTRAALVAVVAALDRVGALEGPSVDMKPPPEAGTRSVTLGATFLGLETHTRPLLRPAERAQACDPRVHSAVACAAAVRAGDSQPGVLVRWLDPRDSPDVQGRNLFIYGAWVEESPLPSWCNSKPVGKIVATRDGAVLIKTPDHGQLGGYGLWITHVRVPLAKAGSGALNPKLPAADGLRSAGLGAALQTARAWNICGKVVFELDKRLSAGSKIDLGWERRLGTWQQTWVEFEDLRDGGKAVYVYFDYYNGACTTYQCEQLLQALRWATHPKRGALKFLVLMGGSYFSNGIALNTIEGSEDPSLESWKNINAINDVVEFILSDSSDVAKRCAKHPKVADAFRPLEGPSLAERGILTIAAVRSNVAAGGFALATAADIVLCAESAVINPHYRGVGLYGSEFHTYSFFERAGADKARGALRGMLPMGAAEACKLGFVDEVLAGGDADGYIERTKAYVRRLASERASAINHYKTAPWTQSSTAPVDSGAPLTEVLIANKLAAHAAFTRPLVSYRHAELSEMLLDFYHQQRSKRYTERRYAFVRKIAPKSTPLRFATHRRGSGDDIKYDEEETDEFDQAKGWTPGSGVEWGWVGLPAPPTEEIWREDTLAKSMRPSKLLLSSPKGVPGALTPGLSAAGTSDDEQANSVPPSPGLSLQTYDVQVKSSSGSTHSKPLAEQIGTKLQLNDAETKSMTPSREEHEGLRMLGNKGRNRSFVSPSRANGNPHDPVPPLPNMLSASSPTRPLRRSRSSIGCEPRDAMSELDCAMPDGSSSKVRSKPSPATAGRISRWFGTTIKSMVPSNNRPGTARSSPSARALAEDMRTPNSNSNSNSNSETGQEILYPCYYNNNN